jgi:broad specificity phosphatase PhoE
MEDEALREMSFSAWEGKSFMELDGHSAWKQFHQSRSQVRPPGGETMLEVQTRVAKFADQVCVRHPNSVVALVSHAEPLRVLLAHWLHIPLDDILRPRVDPASISVVNVATDWVEVNCINWKGELVL